MAQIADAQGRGRRGPHEVPLAPKFAAAGQSTQMVVGATPANDREILATATHLYGQYKLRRIYYTGFSPYPEADARLPLKAAPLMREHRLYQSDWLMRFYGFQAAELTSDEQPDLSLTEDPKTTWARTHPEFFPVDVNAAPREALLRVPGIGYRNVDRILSIRKYHALLARRPQKAQRPRQPPPCPTSSPSTICPTPPSPQPQSPAAAQLDLFAPLSALTGSV